MKEAFFLSSVMLVCGTMFFSVMSGCEDDQKHWQQQKDEAWNGVCIDESVLIATTAGSPNSFKCTNKLHRMRVQVASAPSNEEFGAVVFCECPRDTLTMDGGKN